VGRGTHGSGPTFGMGTRGAPCRSLVVGYIQADDEHGENVE